MTRRSFFGRLVVLVLGALGLGKLWPAAEEVVISESTCGLANDTYSAPIPWRYMRTPHNLPEPTTESQAAILRYMKSNEKKMWLDFAKSVERNFWERR